MSERRAPSLRSQLLWFMLPALFFLWAINAYTAYRSIDEAVTQAHDRTLLASARMIGEQVTLRDGKVRVDVPWVALDTVELDSQGHIYYRVSGPNGEFVSGYDDFPPPPEKVLQTRFYPALVSFRNLRYNNEDLRVAALYSAVIGDDGVGAMTLIQVGETLQARHRLRENLLVGIIWRQGLLVTAGVGLILIAVYTALKPLQLLRRRLSRRISGNPVAINDIVVPREVQPLVNELNNYIERLDATHLNQRRFLADASHQLRTPLTVMMAQIDQTLEQADPQQWRQGLKDLKRVTRNHIRLTNQLLTLARTEASQNNARLQSHSSVDLVGLARQICLENSAAAVARSIDLGFESSLHQVRVRGDLTLLHEAIANVVDNALRYTPEGGLITVSIELGGDQESALIKVEDNGEGIPPALRPKVFERFGRLPDSPSGGSGLGLGIVKDVMALHGGSVTLEDSAQHRGLTVVLTLPLIHEVEGYEVGASMGSINAKDQLT